MVSFLIFQEKLVIFVVDWLLGELLWSLLSESERLHPKSAMVVVFEHGFELIEGYSPIFVVIVLDKLLFGNFVRVLVFNFVEELQVAEDRVEEGLEGVLV